MQKLLSGQAVHTWSDLSAKQAWRGLGQIKLFSFDDEDTYGSWGKVSQH